MTDSPACPLTSSIRVWRPHLTRRRSLVSSTPSPPVSAHGAISSPCPLTCLIPAVYDVGTSSTAGDIFLITFQQFLALSVSARPSVITVSYGSDETDMTRAQATTMCNAAQQLAAAGMTIVFSSGDDGVDGSGGETCPKFVVTYPGGCPYILSVGATQSFSPEVMVDT